jgi:hypothetical protein
VALKEQECDFQTLTEEPKPNFRDSAEVTLHNTGINGDNTL